MAGNCSKSYINDGYNSKEATDAVWLNGHLIVENHSPYGSSDGAQPPFPFPHNVAAVSESHDPQGSGAKDYSLQAVGDVSTQVPRVSESSANSSGSSQGTGIISSIANASLLSDESSPKTSVQAGGYLPIFPPNTTGAGHQAARPPRQQDPNNHLTHKEEDDTQCGGSASWVWLRHQGRRGSNDDADHHREISLSSDVLAAINDTRNPSDREGGSPGIPYAQGRRGSNEVADHHREINLSPGCYAAKYIIPNPSVTDSEGGSPEILYARSDSSASYTPAVTKSGCCGGRGRSGLSTKCNRRAVQRCFMVTFAFTAVTTVAVVMWVILHSVAATFFTTATVELRARDPFHPDLLNLSSALAVNYTDRLCVGMTQSLKGQSDVDKVETCSVINFRNGSIVVTMELSLRMQSNVSRTDFVKDVLLKGFRQTGEDVTMLGDIPVYADSLKVTKFSVTTSADSTATTTTTTTATTAAASTTTATTAAASTTATTAAASTTTTTAAASTTAGSRITTTSGAVSEFNCSMSAHFYLPNPHTFPGRCHEYQRCENGQSYNQSCSDGLEFGYDPEKKIGPCRLPSATTYCGQKRIDSNVTSSPVTSSTVTPCSSLDPLILENSSSLFSCNGSESESFQPRVNTYPDNCRDFVWCQQGEVLALTQCAAGTSFVYRGNTTKPCHHLGDPMTFCAQMKLAQTCRGKG
ncbi:hypothetical protein ACOMHN_019483 [Nucella lapillus]